MAALLPHLVERRDKAAADNREVLVCGDWNIAHREADLKAWRNNRASSGFLPRERAWLDRLFGEAGYVDVVRALHPGQAGPYTWWSYRGRALRQRRQLARVIRFTNRAQTALTCGVPPPKGAHQPRSVVLGRLSVYPVGSDHA